MSELDLEPITVIVHRILELIEHGDIRRAEGIFNLGDGKYYNWKAYTIKHPAGTPTIRVDIKENT